MGKPLRALFVESGEADVRLIVDELERGGFEVASVRVDTAAAMRQALAEHTFDVVLADYSLPGLSAPVALSCFQERQLEIPFVIVSGVVSEEIAVEVMRAGAHDFIPKSNLARLVPVIERELRETGLRLERARMRGQLVVAERMASIGTLAVGVAHEINNPLAALIANLHYWSEEIERLRAELRASVDDGRGSQECSLILSRLGALEEPVRDATEAAERVRGIARDLRHFARPDDEAAGSIDLHKILESSIRMAWNEIRHRARLVRAYANPPLVGANEGRLGQVFLNLLLNAVQSMSEVPGHEHEIVVRTGCTDRGDAFVEIADTGSGIEASVLPRIFDPFFTTKPSTTGSGLGLAISAKIVADLRGTIQVSSRPGHGSTFRVVLPPAESTDGPPTRRTKISTTGRGGRILIVDDEALLGAALRRMLTPRHEVQVETEGARALKLIEEGQRYDVIFCDLMMPELDGTGLHAAVEHIAPAQAQRFVFMTGGAFTPRAREFLEKVGNRTVEKPFDAATIRRIVRECIV